MDIKPYDKTIRDLLGSKRQFIIPRFQRIYSWEKKNYQEFFEDIVSNLMITKDGKIIANQYFLGTMLFIGNFTEGTDQEIQVVDGQQRLTTITILFSAISEKFLELEEQKLSDQIFSYIMTEDDNGNEVRILKSKTSYPFFAYFIQEKNKNISREPSTEEEINIEKTYKYFQNQLRPEKLRAFLNKKHGSDTVSLLRDVDILKAIRDQVLNSTFISISTTVRDQANKIFEILNAKGKRLVYIDLIKNKLFEVLTKTEPADFAEESWKELNAILNSGSENVGIATFYQHYWLSKYGKVSSNRLYEKFSIIPRKKDAYIEFINDLLRNARVYMKMINPNRTDYENRKEYFEVVQSLYCINNFFNVVQTRIALLALFDVKMRDVISLDMLKRALCCMENFHFAYTAILSNRANRLENIYSSFAIALRKTEQRVDANRIIEDQLLKPLDGLFPAYVDFNNKFKELTYSKFGTATNIKTKYALNKLNSLFLKDKVFADNGSIEHIIPEKYGNNSLNIGNLILIEKNLNARAKDMDYKNKLSIYRESKYPWVEEFISTYNNWESANITNRAEKLSKIYYQHIFNKKIMPFHSV